jgi:outer membrane protein
LIQLEQTDDVIASAEAQYLAAQQDLMFRTSRAYFGVLDAQENLKFARANKKAIARQLDQAKQRFEVGLIAITDVHEAQAAYDGARSEEIAAINDVNSAWEALFVIIGPRPIEELAPLKPDLPLTPPKPADMEQWSETALKQNLSVIAAYHNAELARKGIELQRSGHYPTLDLVASYGWEDTTSEAASRFESGLVGVQLAVPLYTGGLVSSQVRQARYDFEAAQDNLEAQRRSVDQVVKDAYRGVLTSIAQVEALGATVVSSESALEATEAGYEVGTRTIIDVLNVQRNKFGADRDYAVARYAYVLNGLLLKQAASILSPEDLAQVNAWLE